MALKFEAFKNEVEELVAFMTATTWTYHATPHSKEERIRAAVVNNYYTAEGCETFWIIQDEKKIGMIRIYDLDDGTPLFDMRFSSGYSGKGLGTLALAWMVEHIFNTYKDLHRIEGNTRIDNYAMRSVFKKCGFVKEAHYREAWVCQNGDVYDSIGYGILRSDWENNTITQVNWNDF